MPALLGVDDIDGEIISTCPYIKTPYHKRKLQRDTLSSCPLQKGRAITGDFIELICTQRGIMFVDSHSRGRG